MADLKPTRERLALLAAVRAGSVYLTAPLDGGYSLDKTTGKRVTAQMDAMARAGWVTPGKPESPSAYAPRPWQITSTGQAVLEKSAGAVK